MLNTMGRIGAQIGYPATKVTVDSAVRNGNAKDKDILVFAETSQDLSGLEKLEPEVLLEKMRGNDKNQFSEKADNTGRTLVTEDTGIAAMAQYESPYSSGRSVVTLMGDGQDGSFILNKRLMNPGDLKVVGGSVAIFRPNAVPSILLHRVAPLASACLVLAAGSATSAGSFHITLRPPVCRRNLLSDALNYQIPQPASLRSRST